jgi:serine phosphatase RsbU (regulator of sigma subunit)/anti-sigma regulatory factor (Ser/Thr protein kinase)
VSTEVTVVRRVRLPADRRTPAAARAVVRSVLDEADLAELADEALLLTTELSTNAVVHAGTDLDLEVVADVTGLTVTVMDFASGMVAAGPMISREERRSPNGRPPLTELSERGRGLLLVDHFASRWGTTHHTGGKGVWFRLDRAGTGDGTGMDAGNAAGPAGPGDAATDLGRLDGAWPAVGRLTPGTPRYRVEATGATSLMSLLQITPDPYADDPVADFAGALLARLAELVGAVGGVVRCDRGDGAGTMVLARYGRAARAGTPTLRIPLALGHPASGELELDAPAAEHVQPLAAVVAERVTLTLENDRLRRADRRRQSWLTFLAEASELLAHSLDVELTLALIPQLVVPRLGQWSAVHTTDAWGRLRLETAAHADETVLPQLYAALREPGPDSVQQRLPEALRFGGQVPLPPPTEGFAVPLIARGQLLGTLAVGRHLTHRHEPEEIAVLEDVARRAALAIDNARIHAERRRIAYTLQRSLLPPALPQVSGVGFGAAYVPTGDTADVGGDFYDVVPLGSTGRGASPRDDRWLVVIGDVSGKGVQAATITGLVREVIRALVRAGRPLPEVLGRLNETLVERGEGRYCTLALASVRWLGEQPGPPAQLEVSLHLAGHDRPVLVRADGRTAHAGTGGTALGLLDTIDCPAETVRLDAGDSLIFYTDGVTERRRGRQLFGGQRLRDAAAPLAGYSAEVIAARLRTTTIGFSAEAPRDDIALLVLRNESAQLG